MAQSELKAVIFDIDGTLVDSNDAHARSWVEAMAEQGYSVAYDEVRRRIGMGGDNLLPEVIGQDKESEVGKALSARRKEIFQSQYRGSVCAFPDVPALFGRVWEAGMKPVLCTSSDQDDLEALLQIAGVEDLAEATTSSQDAPHSKPDPDPLHAALKKSGVRPEQAIMVGDTPFDIEAARKAGVGTIAVRCGGFSDDDLKGALVVYDDPADLLARFDESPLGQFSGLRHRTP